jgi:hypothetical protein
MFVLITDLMKKYVFGFRAGSREVAVAPGCKLKRTTMLFIIVG